MYYSLAKTLTFLTTAMHGTFGRNQCARTKNLPRFQIVLCKQILYYILHRKNRLQMTYQYPIESAPTYSCGRYY